MSFSLKSVAIRQKTGSMSKHTTSNVSREALVYYKLPLLCCHSTFPHILPSAPSTLTSLKWISQQGLV